MKKRNKPAIALAAILMLLGILLILAGFYGNWFFGLFAKSFDPRNIKPEDLGITTISIIKINPLSSLETSIPVKVLSCFWTIPDLTKLTGIPIIQVTLST